jgi:hypothetical protein
MKALVWSRTVPLTVAVLACGRAGNAIITARKALQKNRRIQVWSRMEPPFDRS